MKSIKQDMNDNIKIEKIYDYNDVYRTLIEMSDAYNPPLVTKLDNLSEYATKLSRNADIYVAIDSQLLGFIAFYSNDTESKTVYITQLAVKTDSQSKGIGKRLMSVSYILAKEKGMTSIKLEVNKQNDKAIRFYEKEGFVACGYATTNSIYMKKTI